MTTAMRRLIVNADDFGQSAGVNSGILRGHDEGIVTSASLMVRWPAAAAAADAAKDRGELSVGLHVDLGEWRLVGSEWVPVYQVVPLTDAAAVAAEVRRQLQAFRCLTGENPSHLDSHQHVHRREPVRSVLVDLARELEIPLRHFTSSVRFCGDFYGQDEQGNERGEVLSALSLIRILAALPPGVTELACHPAAAVDLATMYARQRLAELEVLCDSRVKQALLDLGIERCSFRDVGTERRENPLVAEAI